MIHQKHECGWIIEIPDDFIKVGDDHVNGHPNHSYFARLDRAKLKGRWGSVDGRRLLAEIESKISKNEGFDDAVGRFEGKFDLRGIPLSSKKMRAYNFSRCDLFFANLTSCDLYNANFEDSHLSEAIINGADLSWIKTRDTLVDNIKFDRKTKLIGVNLSGLNTNLALEFIAEIRDQERIDSLIRRHPWFAKFLALTSDYGRSLFLWSVWTLVTIAMFAAIYTYQAGMIKDVSEMIDGLYFSIVTFTTLGFGDSYPMTAAGKLIVMLEVIIGYLMGGIFIAILTRRVVG